MKTTTKKLLAGLLIFASASGTGYAANGTGLDATPKAGRPATTEQVDAGLNRETLVRIGKDLAAGKVTDLSVTTFTGLFIKVTEKAGLLERLAEGKSKRAFEKHMEGEFRKIMKSKIAEATKPTKSMAVDAGIDFVVGALIDAASNDIKERKGALSAGVFWYAAKQSFALAKIPTGQNNFPLAIDLAIAQAGLLVDVGFKVKEEAAVLRSDQKKSGKSDALLSVQQYLSGAGRAEVEKYYRAETDSERAAIVGTIQRAAFQIIDKGAYNTKSSETGARDAYREWSDDLPAKLARDKAELSLNINAKILAGDLKGAEALSIGATGTNTLATRLNKSVTQLRENAAGIQSAKVETTGPVLAKQEKAKTVAPVTLTNPSSANKSGELNSLATEQIGLQRQRDAARKAIAETDKMPGGLSDDSRANLLQRQADRKYLDMAELAINRRSGTPESIYESLSHSERTKLLVAAKLLFKLEKTTPRDVIRLISEFGRLDADNRSAFAALGIQLSDGTAGQRSKSVQDADRQKIQGAVDSLNRAQREKDRLTNTLDGLNFRLAANEQKVSAIVGTLLATDARTSDANASTPTSALQAISLQQTMSLASENASANDTDLWSGQGAHISDSGRPNWGSVDYVAALPSDGTSTTLMLDNDGPSGNNAYLRPEFQTGSFRHSEAGRFAQVNDAAFGKFSYVQWGDWAGSGPILTQRDGHTSPISHLYWVGGRSRVGSSDLPRSGSATYVGPLVGDLQNGGTVMQRELSGTITLGVDFASNNISADLALKRTSTGRSLPNVSGTAVMNGNYFETNAACLQCASGAVVQGEFYGGGSGSVPAEAGGTWSAQTRAGYGIGVWRAKKQ